MVTDPLFTITKEFIRSILGREQMKNFVEQIMNTNTVSLWDPIPSLQVKKTIIHRSGGG